MVVATDTGTVNLRTWLGLTAMDSSLVVPVTTTSICNSVALGMNTAYKTSGLVRQLYVIKLGTHYVAQDPGHPSDEWWPAVALDSVYHVTGTVLSP